MLRWLQEKLARLFPTARSEAPEQALEDEEEPAFSDEPSGRVCPPHSVAERGAFESSTALEPVTKCDVPTGTRCEARRPALWDDPNSHPSARSEEGTHALALPIEDFIDLHTFSPKETRAVVEEYLHEAHRKGFREVRVIHGRGKGVQRRLIREALARHPLVASFADAPSHRGGWGATVVQLKEGG